MAQTTPPTVDVLPPEPDTSQPSIFATVMDTFLASMKTFRTQLVALASNVYSNAVDAYNNAQAAANALSAVTAATGVTGWVSGTTYSVGQNRYSIIDFKTYRRTTAGAGTTDPSLDPANWVLISAGAFPLFHVREQVTSGGASPIGGPGANNVTMNRAFNTIITNEMSGASLSSGNVILPPGAFEYEASCPAYNTRHQALLYNVTAAATVGVGTSEYTIASTDGSTRSTVRGKFTLASTQTLQLRHFVSSSLAGTGTAVSSGSPEIYAEARFWRIA